MQKTAIDQAAKDYWGTYFKEYGKQWVRDIPRRIKTAMRKRLQASTIEGDIAPIAADVSKNNTLSVEAAFVGKVDEQDARILVTASFDNTGSMKELICNRVS